MKLTKYQHACLVIEESDSGIVIDPGAYTHDFIMPKRVNAIVITHEHPDHYNEELVKRILTAHPKATVIAHESISGQFTNYTSVAAKLNEVYSIASFTIQLFGGVHASISPSIQTPPNFGVLVNERLYYPGDSFVIPEGKHIQELALPVSAPWLKISEVIEFFSQVRPAFAFPTHDAILSNEGKELVDRLLGATASGISATYKRLDATTVQL